jgi:hypothetical protein
METPTSKTPQFETDRTTRRHLGRIAGSVLGVLLLLWSQSVSAAVISVTGTGDTIANDTFATLREAITSMNNQADVNGDITVNRVGTYGTNDTINFSIPGAGVKTISVTGSALPTITKPVTINGYSQTGTSANTMANSDNAVLLIELNGAGAGSAHSGLTLGAGSTPSTIKGLVINRFLGNGIVVQSNSNNILGNFIGTDPTGTTRMPNGTFPNFGNGVLIQNVSSNNIGSPTPADRNVISGNALNGIHILGTLSAPATGNRIQGNFIGVAKNGVSGVGPRSEPAPAMGATEGNNLYGIDISGGNVNTIGGSAVASRNVIGFNAEGISLDNGAQSNTIQENFIGVGADGVTPTGNLLHGVALRSSNTFSAPLGPPQPNEPGVSGNVIGGAGFGENVIAFNGTAGVAVFGNPVSASGQPNTNNAIERNSIFQNGRSYQTASSAPLPLLGIDLSNGSQYPKDDGITPNDSKGHAAPNNPNNFQNFPVMTTASSSGGTTTIAGTLSSAPNSTFRIDLFVSDPDPLGLPPEGQQFLGFVSKNTDANGNLSFSTLIAGSLADGRIVTGTATDSIGNTSEFSAGIVVPTQPPTPTPTPTATATATPTATPPAQALNISTRMSVQTGNNVLIAGFIVTGVDQKTVAVRGIGPSLAQFFSGTLSDPTLELHSGNTTLIANDNWQDDPAQAAQLSANGLALSDPREAGIVATLPSQANYSAILAGKNGDTGIGLVELYDLDQAANSQLANISTRGFVQTGNNVMIGGFILGGNAGNTRVAVRGIGPSLAQFGLNPVLADPTLELHDGNGATLAANDNWQDDATQAAALTANGLAPSDPNEAGIFTPLPPGQFTAILAGKNSGIGIGLVEIYNLH